MTRVKRGVIKTKKRKKILQYTKGYRWGRKSKLRAAREALLHAWSYAYRDRKAKKREFRKLWNIKINAGVRSYGLRYNTFMHALKRANILLDRKILAQLAEHYPEVFAHIVKNIQ